MLAAFRNFAKSWVAILLLGLLIISFAIFGMNDVFAPSRGDWVIQAGKRTVSAAEFKSVFDNYREQLGQQQQRPVTVEQAVEQNVHTRILDELASGQAFAEVLVKLGVRPADTLVTEQIREFQGFFSPITGQFDRETYIAELGRNGLTPERFEGELRDSVAQQHFVAGVVAGLRAPRAYGAAAAAFESELRDVSLALVPPTAVERPAPPTDVQLNAFLRENADALRRPELRAVTVVRFNAADAARTAAVDPAEVERQFNFRRDSLSQPERRTFVQIPAPDQAAAAQVAQRLRAGEDPAAVARSIQRDPVPFNAVPRSAVTDARIAEAAFSLPAGQVSGPVQGQLAWSVVKVLTVAPAVPATLDQARPQIEAELRAMAAEQQVTAAVERYEQAREAGANLVEAARQAGVQSLSLAPFSREGATGDGAPAALEPALLEAAFSTAQGGETDIQETAPGQFAALRVDRVIAPALPTLEEVRGPLTGAWFARELRNRIQTRAQALATAVRGGAQLQAAAQGINAPFVALPGLTRAGGAQTPPEVAQNAFTAKRGEVFVTDFINTQAGPIGVGVGRVDAVRFPPAPVMAATLAPRRDGITAELLQDMGEVIRLAARAAMKVRTNPERALEVLGVTPAAGADGAAPAGGARGGSPAQ